MGPQQAPVLPHTLAHTHSYILFVLLQARSEGGSGESADTTVTSSSSGSNNNNMSFCCRQPVGSGFGRVGGREREWEGSESLPVACQSLIWSPYNGAKGMPRIHSEHSEPDKDYARKF